MNIILIKLYSLFIETKDTLQVFLSQFANISFKPKQVFYEDKNKNKFNSKIANELYKVLLFIFMLFKIVVTGIAILLKFLQTILIVKDKGLIGFGVSVIKIILFLIPVFIISLYFYLSGNVDPDKLEFYQNLHRYRTATAISDQQGHLIGSIANTFATKADNTPNNTADTLYVNSIPKTFWDIIKLESDNQLQFNYKDTGLLDILLFRKHSYKGINITKILSKPISSRLYASNVPSKTPLIENIINNLYGRDLLKKQCSITTLQNSSLNFFRYINKKIISVCKNIEYLRASRHLFPYLARLNGLEFKRWTAMHTPPLSLDTLSLDKNTSGLRSISEVLFAKKLEKLNEAQQAILAVAYLDNFRFFSTAANNQIDSITRLKNKQLQLNTQQLISQSIIAVQNTYGSQQSEKAKRIIAALNQIDLSLKPTIPKQFTQHIHKLAYSRQQDYWNIKKRRKLFIAGFDDLIKQQIRNIYANINKNKVITDIIVTLPVIDNLTFIDKINTVMKQVLSRCKKCANKLSGGRISNKDALIRIIVSNEQGKIIRYYSNGEVAKRPIADITKLPASILLASLGDMANSQYCRRKDKNLKFDTKALVVAIKKCSSLQKEGQTISFKDMFAASYDLPFYYALTQKHSIPEDKYTELYQDFNLDVYSNQKATNQVLNPLPYDLSFGKAKSTPQAIHKFTHKITQTLFNSVFETDPFAIEQFQIADIGQSIENYYSGSLSSNNTLQKYLKLSSAKAELRKILRAPVYNQAGTLSSFQNISGVRFLFAKSGTRLMEKNTVKDNWVVGAFTLKGKIYSFLIFVGSNANNDNGLGKDTSRKSLMYQLMQAVINSI